jgi:hypothetical protein
MQLTSTSSTNAGTFRDIRARLGSAVVVVLGAVHGVALADSTPGTTEVDSSLMHYKESGGRVSTTEGVVSLKQTQEDGTGLSLKLTYDTLSGGSPNGALPSKKTQTFAHPSGTSLTPPHAYTTASGGVVQPSGPYTVAPGQLPMDPSFRDQRYAANLDWTTPIDGLSRLTLGGGFSHETDFQSLSASTTYAYDLNDKNTTLSAGLNLEMDSIRPIGGAPVPMSDYTAFLKDGNKSKRVYDTLLGISQVMTRRWITQLNWSMDKSNGYQNDPYKILSELDSQGNTVGYFYENRPGNRTRNSLYWGNKFALDHDTIDFSYRYMQDDWGIHSNTFELRYRWALSDDSYIEPQYRYYTQTAANFFRYYLTQGDPAMAYASADPRLAQFHATTLGLRWATKIDTNTEIGLRYETYKQTGKQPAVVPTQLQGLDLYPGLRAQMIEANLKFSF